MKRFVISNGNEPLTALPSQPQNFTSAVVARPKKQFVFDPEEPMPDNVADCDTILDELCTRIEDGETALIPIYKTFAQLNNRLAGWQRMDINWPHVVNTTIVIGTQAKEEKVIREETEDVIGLVKKLLADGKTPDQIKRSTGISKLITRKYMQ